MTMFDGRDSNAAIAYGYEPDTVVLDPEDVTMQVFVEHAWHRRLHASVNETACGEVFHAQYQPTRRESLDGPLCRNCFSIRELSISEDIAERKRAELEEQSPIETGTVRRRRDTKVDP
jgi:hypothetical protein